jgi:hypothetical protein
MLSSPEGSSQLLAALIDYLRARPRSSGPESTAFDGGSSELEGVTRGISELQGLPAIRLQPQVGRPGRTAVYFDGGGYVSGSPPERNLPLADVVALAAHTRVRVVDHRLAPGTDCSRVVCVCGDGVAEMWPLCSGTVVGLRSCNRSHRRLQCSRRWWWCRLVGASRWRCAANQGELWQLGSFAGADNIIDP